MAQTPDAIEIRQYQVGFGDCYLLSFAYGPRTGKRHVLVDFGTSELPRGGGRGKPADYMAQVARHIAKTCGGHLTAVVLTHRHLDHISGFATDGSAGDAGRIIKDLAPDVVLQPWTEDPDAARDARSATRDASRSPKSVVAGLTAIRDVARMISEVAQRPPAWMTPLLRRELGFIGQTNISNESAVRNLIAMGKARGATAVWAHHGSPSGLEAHLPGVKVHVLGPPDLTQSEAIRSMRKTDPDQFWFSLAGPQSVRDRNPLDRGFARDGSGGTQPRVPIQGRWFRDRLDRMRGQQLLEIVRTLDDQMNNTSLVLLFEIPGMGRKLLFPGDAQIENWSYALQDAPDAEKTRALLADVDVYKVGHHGSLNATPRQLLWDHFRKRSTGRLHTLLSTLPGKHGHTQNNTEVPRKPLLKALSTETALLNTNDKKFSASGQLCHVLPIKA